MSGKPYRAVRQVMSGTPYLIEGMATVAEAVRLMKDKGVSSLVIRKRHDGDEYGMVVIQDIADKVIAQDRAPDRVNVYEIMSKPLIAVQADMDVKYAIRLLGRFRLSRAIVLDHGALVGITTLRDLVLAHLTGDETVTPAPAETT
ncbi:CBS domain-containing protein [Roseospira goensis]|uniref:Signal-transduction protein with cAMP-binding, CBS, and nucleotidyltransferase domain n=1 Tax=Roseospira goensis TaxID=391922 RepID=A0A7W6S1Y4_9PROT|nr:CBS domain-containing protein [Roseospira goensis]MBB4287420.1 signal-transduction protein with cAMP-binding, CBS, and nucleotidyltransferase domain [Roseospira goensis]